MVVYTKNGFYTYIAKNNEFEKIATFCNIPAETLVFIPTDVNSMYISSQLISIAGNMATKYTFARDMGTSALLTGAINSLGVVEKNYYKYINSLDGNDFYAMGTGATFSYANIFDPVVALAASESYMNGTRIDNKRYTYENAVLHRQGLGFCGFEKMTCHDKRGYTQVRTYDPCNFAILKSDVTPEYENTYNYEIKGDFIKKILLTQKTEYDKLKNITASTSYVYDEYGFPTQETATYSDGITITTENTYAHEPTVGDGYNLGFQTVKKTTTTRGESSDTEQMLVLMHVKRLPGIKLYTKNGARVKEITYSHDNYGNILTEKAKNYSSTDVQQTSYTYNLYGRLSKITNHMGLSNTFIYDTYGRKIIMKDHRGGTTQYEYDEFGRETLERRPDGTTKTTEYTWTSQNADGLYSITKTETGKPTTKTEYDALNREVRNSDMRFNGIMRNIDKVYDEYGNLQKESLPFTGTTASQWNTYSHDTHNRITGLYEASGRRTTYHYDGNSVTTTSDGIATKRIYDSQGCLIASIDPAGTTTYDLAADGQPLTIVAPGDVTTSFEYDYYGRRKSLDDPSCGITTYEYDQSGNMVKETNAKGEVTEHTYDQYGRIVETTAPEHTITFTYNRYGDLTSSSITNGTVSNVKSMTYDKYGRLSSLTENSVNHTFHREYEYSDGNLSSTRYTTSNGTVTENRRYSNGHLSKVLLNGNKTVFNLTKENSMGQPVEVSTGGLVRKYEFTTYGLPARRSATYGSRTLQDFSYNFDPETNNLLSRTDNIRGITESFDYDELNRLTSYGGKNMTYNEYGNITSKSDAGTYTYKLYKPYQMSTMKIATGSNMDKRVRNRLSTPHTTVRSI